jgi:prepilin-type N-terminal cleavage/methylation domain-containing protein
MVPADADTPGVAELGAGKLRRGVTLIESVVSLSLFAVFMSSTCSLIVVTKQTCDRARMRYHAVNIAKNRIERVAAFEFDQMSLCVQGGIVVDGTGGIDANGDYRLTTAVTPVGPGLSQVAVTVQIRNRRTMLFDGEEQVITSYLSDLRT